MCIERSFVPSGSVTVIGFIGTLLLTTGAPSRMKWLVALDSDTAHSTTLVIYFLFFVEAVGIICVFIDVIRLL